MMKDKLVRNNSGQLLIEAMIAVSLVIVGLLGTFAVLSQSLGLNRVATDQHIAVGLASEGIEIVKNIIDKDAREGGAFAQSINRTGQINLDYTTGLTDGYEMSAHDSGDPLFLRLNKDNGRYGYLEGDNTKFVRYVEIDREDVGGSEIIRVKSVVEWPARGGLTGSIEVEDTFYDWRHLP